MIAIQKEKTIVFSSSASLVEEDREVAAWYSDRIQHNKAHRWVLGRFVESERPNRNGQMFSTDGLVLGKPTIVHSPMNINHASSRVIGAFVGADIVYSTEQNDNPYIEALGVVWKYYFPEEFALIETAHAMGVLAYSMECVPEAIQCSGDSGCNEQFAYMGAISPSYCEHLNNRVSDKLLINPHFVGGALVVPPAKPGWKDADVYSLVAKDETTLEKVATEFPHLNEEQWINIMSFLQKSFNATTNPTNKKIGRLS